MANTTTNLNSGEIYKIDISLKTYVKKYGQNVLVKKYYQWISKQLESALGSEYKANLNYTTGPGFLCIDLPKINENLSDQRLVLILGDTSTGYNPDVMTIKEWVNYSNKWYISYSNTKVWQYTDGPNLGSFLPLVRENDKIWGCNNNTIEINNNNKDTIDKDTVSFLQIDTRFLDSHHFYTINLLNSNNIDISSIDKDYYFSTTILVCDMQNTITKERSDGVFSSSNFINNFHAYIFEKNKGDNNFSAISDHQQIIYALGKDSNGLYTSLTFYPQYFTETGVKDSFTTIRVCFGNLKAYKEIYFLRTDMSDVLNDYCSFEKNLGEVRDDWKIKKFKDKDNKKYSLKLSPTFSEYNSENIGAWTILLKDSDKKNFSKNLAVKFSGDKSFTLSSKGYDIWNGILEYSIDEGEEWTIWDGTTLTGDKDQPIYLRGTSNTYLTKKSYGFNFTGQTISGDIETLFDYETVKIHRHPKIDSYCCQALFKNCTNLKNVSKLKLSMPNLSYECYKEMFSGCTSLINPPTTLPAINLATNCYEEMFYNCSSLKKTPKLPATTLSYECYKEMFRGCTSLEEVLDLPATILSYGCYNSMFYNCKKLKKVPNIKINAVSSNSCYRMFEKCSALENIDISLNALNLIDLCYSNKGAENEYLAIEEKGSCYERMFFDCSSLKKGPELPAITLSRDCYAHMFENCSSMTVGPTILPAEHLSYLFNYGYTSEEYPYKTTYYASGCYESMFSGCSSLKRGPEISALDLCPYCFRNMFYNCIAMTTGPSILAATNMEFHYTTVNTKTAAYYCYFNMFKNCTSLKTAPKIMATEFGNSCCYGMFSGCTSLIKVYDLKATRIGEYACNGMFQECTSLVNAPEIPIIQFLDSNYWYKEDVPDDNNYTNCYDPCCYMFQGCTSLINPPTILPATNLATNCYYKMFSECTSLKNTPILPATKLKYYCYAYMFEKCAALKTITDGFPIITDFGGEYSYPYHYMFGESGLETIPTLPTLELGKYCYEYMFYKCKKLKNIPKLPATILADGCYEYMFAHCTSLVEAPEFANTELAPYCCHYMFAYCDSLVNIPTLKEKQLAEGCYGGMFAGCISLEKIPKLPATTLAKWCYGDMFADCTSLTTKPELPAINLAEGCYGGMFAGCISLENPPDLPIMELAPYCYRSMFSGCKKLNFPTLPAKKMVDGCYANMFEKCVFKTVPTLPTTILAAKCYEEMFKDCVLLEEAPDLPIMELAPYCYKGMFSGCEKLKKVVLPATTLANYCYEEMFNKCSLLKEAPELPATTLAEGCYRYMFEDCTFLDKAPDLPATTLKKRCYQYMFSHCTSLEQAPELPATVLAEECYECMFEKCTKLKSSPTLPATELADRCYYSMFIGCTSLTTLAKLPALNIPVSCYKYMYYGCSRITLFTTSSATYKFLFRIPIEGTGKFTTSYANNYIEAMFENDNYYTAGWRNPTINTSYYVSYEPV